MINQRIEWIDILKGLAIILVVMGHLTYSESNIAVKSTIYSFHMAMFFVLAGCTAVISQRSKTLISFVKLKFLTLCIPYVLWNFLYLPFPRGESITADYNFYERLEICVSGRCNHGGCFWFLLTLFVLQCIYVLYLLLEKRVKNGIIKALIIAVLYIPVIILNLLYGDSGNGFGLATQVYLFYIPFFVGACMIKYPVVYRFLFNKWVLTLFVLLVLYIPSLKGDFEHTGHVGRIAGIAMTCLFARLIENKSFLSPFINERLAVIGGYSLAIYIFHYTFVYTFSAYDVAVMAAHGTIVTSCVYFLVAVFICYFCIGIAKIINMSPLLNFLMLGKVDKRG